MKMNVLDWIAFILVIIGGINWGLWGLFHFNLVAAIFGPMSILSRIIYILVGLAAIYLLFFIGKCCKCKRIERVERIDTTTRPMP